MGGWAGGLAHLVGSAVFFLLFFPAITLEREQAMGNGSTLVVLQGATLCIGRLVRGQRVYMWLKARYQEGAVQLPTEKGIVAPLANEGGCFFLGKMGSLLLPVCHTSSASCKLHAADAGSRSLQSTAVLRGLFLRERKKELLTNYPLVILRFKSNTCMTVDHGVRLVGWLAKGVCGWCLVGGGK